MSGVSGVPDDEFWMPVKGYEGLYRVSRNGDIERCDYTIVTSRGVATTFPARPLKHRSEHPRGHEKVALYKDRVRKNVYWHHVVLECFGFYRPSADSVCRHLDGNPKNNRLDNLAWGSAQDNAIDACYHGTLLKKLSLQDMRDIRAALKAPYRGQSADLARQYGVTPSSIHNVKRGRTGYYDCH